MDAVEGRPKLSEIASRDDKALEPVQAFCRRECCVAVTDRDLETLQRLGSLGIRQPCEREVGHAGLDREVGVLQTPRAQPSPYRDRLGVADAERPHAR